MSTSAETAGRRTDVSNDNTVPMPPSHTTEPTTVTDASQQGATQPGSGSTVPADGEHQPTFKEKVVGYAKEIRGTTLGKPETKEQGERIVHGQETFEPKKVGPKAP